LLRNPGAARGALTQALAGMKLRTIILISFSFCLSACSLQPAREVSSSELLENPHAFEGQRIRLEGFVSYGFENCVIEESIWYWPKEGNCYDMNSRLNAWQGHGIVTGTVSLSNHGHLGSFPFSIVNATVEHR
jgi:hypothetical protein